MKLITLFLLMSSSVLFEYANAGSCKRSCEITEISENDWYDGLTLPAINDTHGAKQLVKYDTNDVSSVSAKDKYPYINATTEDGKFIISTTEEFLNFDMNEIGSSASPIYTKLYVYCGARGSGSKNCGKLTIYQPVIDINSHPPTFTKEIYEYDFKGGIHPDFELTQFGSISAFDYDFSNEKVYFTITDDKAKEYFKIENEVYRGKKNKNYTTTLTAIKNIMGPFSMEFDILATDSGKPSSLNSTTKVKVSVTGTCGESVFSKNLYFAEYDDKHELKMIDEISMQHDSKEIINIEQSDYKDYIKISQDPSAKDKIIIEKLKDLPKDSTEDRFIKIDITAKSESFTILGSAALLVHFIEEDQKGNENAKTPVFGEYMYFATYSLDEGLKTEKQIILKYGTSKKLTVTSQGYEEFFQVAQNSKTKEQIDITTLKPLTSDILKKGFIIIYIKANVEGIDTPGLTALLVKFNVHPPLFTKHLYNANFSANQLHMEEPIKVYHGATSKMNLRLKNYQEYFTVSQNVNIIEQIDVRLKKPLSDKILEENVIVLEIEAENEGLNIPGSTALLIRFKTINGNLDSCDGLNIWGFAGGNYILPLFLFFGAITLIVSINVVVLSFYIKKQKTNAAHNA